MQVKLYYDYTRWSKTLCAPDDYSTKNTQKYFKHFQSLWRCPSQNTFGMWTVLYWTRSSRTQFGVSINVWRLAGDTLSVACNFLYCIHQVHRGFLITLYLCLFNTYPAYWTSCRSHADQIFPKLPAPHKRSSRPALLYMWQTVRSSDHNGCDLWQKIFRVLFSQLFAGRAVYRQSK
jgi:hypothetical protein